MQEQTPLQPIKKTITISRRALPFLLLAVLISLGATGYVFAEGVRVVRDSYRAWQPPQWSQVSVNTREALRSFFSNGPTTASAQDSVSTTVQPVRVVDEQSQVIDVVKRTSGAVVSIIASGEVPRLEECYRRLPGFPLDFESYDIPTLCQNGTERRRVGAGTGFIVSGDGYVLTNKHVVSDEKAEYTVVLNDNDNVGKKYPAKVLARDPNNDVAVLKIDARDLPHLVFSDSSKLQVGQTVIAIGYALGEFDNTVSKGVVSGLSRAITARGTGLETEELRGLIQTDTAINPGNSGGPLLDIDGNVIGMNVAVADAQSIGFAIPSNVAQYAYDQVRTTGKITAPERAMLGVRYTPVTLELQEKNRLPYDYGMLVSRGTSQNDAAIIAGSPAAKAGIEENDIILELNNKQLNERYQLGDAIAAMKPGDKVTLKVYHKGAVKEVTVTLEKRS